MKHPMKVAALRPVLLLLLCSLFNLAVFAQTDGGSSSSSTSTEKTSVTVTSNGNPDAWYMSPWVWVVGAAVFILLLVALLSNKGRDTVTTDRVKVTKTVERGSASDV